MLLIIYCCEIVRWWGPPPIFGANKLLRCRKLFWVGVDYDAQNAKVDAYLNTAWMDGAGATTMATYRYSSLSKCPCMAIDRASLSVSVASREPFQTVSKVDTYDLEGKISRSAYLAERNYLPSHIFIFEGDLIWAGRPTDSSGSPTDVVSKARLEHDGINFVYKDYIYRNLTHVTGLTHYGFSPKLANSSLKERARESHLCKGIPLLSETGSSRCACPLGTRPTVDGSSCKS